jgi:acyl carrier protein
MTTDNSIPNETLEKINAVLFEYCHIKDPDLIHKKITELPIDSIDFVEIIFEIEEILETDIEVENVDFNLSIMELVSSNYE